MQIKAMTKMAQEDKKDTVTKLMIAPRKYSKYKSKLQLNIELCLSSCFT